MFNNLDKDDWTFFFFSLVNKNSRSSFFFFLPCGFHRPAFGLRVRKNKTKTKHTHTKKKKSGSRRPTHKQHTHTKQSLGTPTPAPTPHTPTRQQTQKAFFFSFYRLGSGHLQKKKKQDNMFFSLYPPMLGSLSLSLWCSDVMLSFSRTCHDQKRNATNLEGIAPHLSCFFFLLYSLSL